MPVTAKLSKLFYDRFGEAVTNELVTGLTTWTLRTSRISVR